MFKPDCCTFVHISAAFNCVYFSSYRRTFCARCFWCLLITRGVLFAAYNITATPFTYFPLFLERTEKFFVWRHCGNKPLLTNFRDTDAQNVIFRINTFCGLIVYFQECLFVYLYVFFFNFVYLECFWAIRRVALLYFSFKYILILN